MLASGGAGMLKVLSVAHCYSLTAPFGVAKGCKVVIFQPEIFELDQCTVSTPRALSKKKSQTFHFVRILFELSRQVSVYEYIHVHCLH